MIVLIERRAASTLAYALVAVVLVVAATGAYVFVIGTGSSSPSTSGAGTSYALSSTASSTHMTGSSESSSSTSSVSTTSQPSQASTTSLVTTSLSASTTTIGSTTCTTTGTTTTGSDVLNFTDMFAQYSEMAIHFNGTENGDSVDTSSDYQVVAMTSISHTVNVTLTSGGNIEHFTDYIFRNGTAAAVYYQGQNYTGVSAFSLYFASMSTYLTGSAFGTAGIFGQLENTTYIQQTGTGTVTLGPTQVSVTDYSASTIPLIVNTCDTSANFTKFYLQIGSVAGASLQLLTSLEMTGSFTSAGVSQSLDISLHVTSVTRAA